MAGLVGDEFGKKPAMFLRTRDVRHSELVEFDTALHPVQSHVDTFSHFYPEFVVG